MLRSLTTEHTEIDKDRQERIKHFKDFISISSRDSVDSIEESIRHSKFEHPLYVPAL